MSYDAQTAILGQGQATAAQIDAFMAARGQALAADYAPDGQYKAPPAGLGQTIIAECGRYGDHVVNADLAAAQIADETAGWQSKYARERNNPGGIGAENDNPDKAIWFTAPAAGVRAHVAHLLTYAVGDGPWRAVDPRFADVKAAGWLGVAHVLADLNGRWAYPGTTYGQSIAQLANQLLATPGGTPMPSPYPFIRGLVDIRAQLATADRAGHGPRDRRAMSDKRGVVVHYSGPPNPKRDDPLYMMKMEAQYHVDKNWAADGDPPIYGDGYMYHVVIDDYGTKYLCRDLEAVLWHCAAWPQNAIALSVHVLIGDGQHATPAALTALGEVVDDWRAQTETPLAEVWGHQELSSTSCPGSLMADFVYPYRSNGGSKPMATGQFFAETGHRIDHGFWDYWQGHGGLMQFGFPLTEEVQEDDATAPGGKRTVQYFERAVFEWHPEEQGPFQVLLRRVGADAAKAGGYSGPGI